MNCVMTVTFNICNVSFDHVDRVMMRKFFQMVFVGDDRKSLHIYTATVLGADKRDKNKDKAETEAETEECRRRKPKPAESLDKDYISAINELREFCMKFDIIVTGNDDNDVVFISSEDVTHSKDLGFLAQEDCIRQIWGKECKVLRNVPQVELRDEFYNIFGDQLLIESGVLAQMAQTEVLCIRDKSKRSDAKMDAIAIPGTFSHNPFLAPKGKQIHEQTTLVEGSECAFYRITVPDLPAAIHKGTELVNWVKTTIQFKYPLRDQNLNFCIKNEEENERHGCTTYLAPDITWYFSPPLKSYISHESSSVEVQWKQNRESCKYLDSCGCPIQLRSTPHFTTRRYDNAVNPVANKTTVNFPRWTKDEKIGDRQKYRISARNIFPTWEEFNSVRELNIFIDATDEHNRGNRQFILSLFIAVVLAFGVNSDSIQAAKSFFPFTNFLAADTWWLIMVTFLMLNLLILPARHVKSRSSLQWRRGNIILSFSWALAIFCGTRSQVLSELFSKLLAETLAKLVETVFRFTITMPMVAQGAFLVILASNFSYVLYNRMRYKESILAGLLDDTIL